MSELREKIFTKVREILAEKLSLQADTITEESTFSGDLSMDSLDQADLVMALEERYGVDFSTDDSDRFKAVKDVVDAISDAVDKNPDLASKL